MTTAHPCKRRTVDPAAPLVVLALLLAACSGSTPAASPSSAAATPTTVGQPTASASPSNGSSAAPQPPAPAPSTLGTGPGVAGGPATDGLLPASERPAVIAPPVPLNSPAAFGNGVTARVVRTDSVTSSGNGPGQVSGDPAIAFTIVVENGSAQAVPLGSTTVTASYGPADVPGLSVEGPPSQPLAGVLAARASATAVYVFSIPVAERDQVTLTLDYSADTPTVVFSGSLS